MQKKIRSISIISMVFFIVSTALGLVYSSHTGGWFRSMAVYAKDAEKDEVDYLPVITYNNYEDWRSGEDAELIEASYDKDYYYDVDNDGDKELISFKLIKTYSKDRATATNVYIDRRKTIVMTGSKGADPYIFSCDGRAILLHRLVHGDGGISYYAYPYKDGEYEEREITIAGGFSADIEAWDDTLVLISEPKGWWWFNSFDKYSEDSDYAPFSAMNTYYLMDGELYSVGSYAVPEKTVICEAKKDMKTSKKHPTLHWKSAKKDGPEIKKGDEVILKHISYIDATNFWEVEIDGERGWIPDSKKYPLMVKEIK